MSDLLNSFSRFLAKPDADRLCRTLNKLSSVPSSFGRSPWFALTGSLATELQLISNGIPGRYRSLSDIDLVVESFDAIPHLVSRLFLCTHAHPDARDGKLVMQLVDSEEAIRIDLFKACGHALDRSQKIGPIACLSIQDLVAKIATYLLDLKRGSQVPKKYADAFERTIRSAKLDEMTPIWADYVAENQPADFKTVLNEINQLLHRSSELLIDLKYCTDLDYKCRQCSRDTSFELATNAEIFAVLGYV